MFTESTLRFIRVQTYVRQMSSRQGRLVLGHHELVDLDVANCVHLDAVVQVGCHLVRSCRATQVTVMMVGENQS